MPTIRTKLTWIVLACLTPALIGFALLIAHFLQREGNQVKQDSLVSARTLIRAVDRDLLVGLNVARALASSPSLDTPELAAFLAQAQGVLGEDFVGYNIVLSDRNGTQLINTLRPLGEPKLDPAAGKRLRRIFESGKPEISDLFIGGVVGGPVVSVRVPVRRNGEVVYVLSVSFLPDRLGKVLDELRLPNDYVIAILDSQGVIVARTREPERFVGRIAAPGLVGRIQEVDEDIIESVTVDGVPVYSMFSRSRFSGWTVVIGVSRSAVVAGPLRSVVWLIWVVATMTIIGLAVAWKLAGDVRRSVKSLVAAAFSSGDPVRPPLLLQIAFREAREVATVLAQHHDRLDELVDQRTRQLTESNDRLVASERMIRAVTDNLPSLVSYWDVDLRCRFANRQFLEWFGKTPAEMAGIAMRDLLGDDRITSIEPHFQRAVRGEVETFEMPLEVTSGRTRDTLTSYVPDRSSDGSVVGVFALVSDVTALKRAEEAQRIAATAFESSESMMITDAELAILQINHSFSEATGYSMADIGGQTPRLFKSGRHDAAFYEAMWECLTRTGSWKGEVWNRNKDGGIVPTWMNITAVKSAAGTTTHYVSSHTDIAMRKAADEEIRQLAFFDALTGLPNRRLLTDRLRQTLAGSVRTGRTGALMFIDLDDFKRLNDTLGHEMGDLLLQQVSVRLTRCTRATDTVARLGGDEFVVLLADLIDTPEIAATQAEQVGAKILAVLNQTFDLNEHTYRSTPSIGVTMFDGHNGNGAELMRRADLAMYQAKVAGRNALRFYDPELQAAIDARVRIIAELQEAIAAAELVLHYQTQVDQTGEVVGVEALVRWLSPRRGLISPLEFIPIAEETGLIRPLGLWVIEAACRQLAAWAIDPLVARLIVSVNVSVAQFRHATFVADVLAVLDRTAIDATRLKLELTESLLLTDVDNVILKMNALNARGIRFSLDDFGTGYSSLTYLKRLPLFELKVDRSFVTDVLFDRRDAAIARSIVALAQSLGLSVAVEGLEIEAQRRFFVELGCETYQGFLFSRPKPVADLEDALGLVPDGHRPNSRAAASD